MKRSNFKLFGLLVALFACVTLLASCSMLNAKVTMHIQGSEVQVVNASYGSKYELPELQNRDLYLFEGWYDNSELAGEPIVEVIVGENTHVWAKWNLLTNVKGISVKAAPTKQAYTAFEKFNPEGLVVVAVCEDGSEYEIGNHLLSFDKSELKVTDKKVVISWEEYTTEVEVSVQKASFDLSSIRFADKAVIYNGKAQSINYTGLLPNGLKAEVKGEGVNVGEYDVELVFSVEDEANYNVPENLSAVLKVEQATFDVSGVVLESDEVTYDGEEHTLSYKGELPEGVEATVSKHVNAGTHTVTLTFTHENPNYKQIPAKTGTLVINKADYEFDVEWDYTAAFTYNPEKEHSVLLKSELPEGVELVGYTGNTGKNAGDYTAVATFKSTNPNYNDPKEVSLDWTINPAQIDMSAVAWDYTDALVYSKYGHTVAVKNLPANVSVEYTGNTGTTVGEYQATATFIPDANYELINNNLGALDWEIVQATHDMSNVKWDYVLPFINDGETKVVSVTGLPEGVTVKEYVNASASATGKYTASVVFEYDEDNYYEPTCEDLNWEIKDIISIAEAIEIGSEKAHNTYTTEKYYVEGIITSITDTGFGNLYIIDADGNEILVYGTYSADGETRYDALEVKPVVGDKILVYGKLGTYNSNQQFKNAWLIKQDLELSDKEKAVFDRQELELNSPVDSNFDLPLKGSNGSVIEWTVKEGKSISINNGVAVVTQPGINEENEEVTLLATIIFGSSTLTKEIKVTVLKESPVKYIDLTADALGLGSYADGSKAVNNIDFSWFELGDYGFGIQMRKKNNNSALWNTESLEGAILRIELTYNTEKKTYSNSDAFIFTFGNEADSLTYEYKFSTVADTKEYTITPDKEEYTYFKMKINISYSFYWDRIRIWYDTSKLPGESESVQLAKPENVLVEADGDAWKVSFDAVENADSYKAYVYAGAELVHEQEITNGGVINYTTPGTYTVSVKAIAGEGYLDSEASNAVDWVIAAPVEPDPNPEPSGEVTIAEALALADGTEVVIKATVHVIDGAWSTEYNNMNVTLKDETGTLYVYRLATQVKLGDIVTVTGTMATYNEARQIGQGATAVVTGHDTSYDPVASSASISFASTVNRTSLSTTQQVWEQNGIKVTGDKASSTTNVADYSNPARFYKGSNLTIEFTSAISKIVITCSGGTKYYVLEGQAVSAGTLSVDGAVCTITFDTPVTSVVLTSLGQQTRIASIEVTPAE